MKKIFLLCIIFLLSGCAVSYYRDSERTIISSNAGRAYKAETTIDENKKLNGFKIEAGVDPMARDLLMQGIEIGKAIGSAGLK